MIILVEHEVPNDPTYCSDGDSGGWRNVCKYVKYRAKTGKRGTRPQNLPRCDLFLQWLDTELMAGQKKCAACLIAKQKE